MENEIIKIELEKKEIELLITALDKLQLSGLQAAQFVLNTAAKLHTSLEKDKPLGAFKMDIKK